MLMLIKICFVFDWLLIFTLINFTIFIYGFFDVRKYYTNEQLTQNRNWWLNCQCFIPIISHFIFCYITKVYEKFSELLLLLLFIEEAGFYRET